MGGLLNIHVCLWGMSLVGKRDISGWGVTESLGWLWDILVSLDRLRTVHSTTELKLFSPNWSNRGDIFYFWKELLTHLFQTTPKLHRKPVVISQIPHLQDFRDWTQNVPLENACNESSGHGFWLSGVTWPWLWCSYQAPLQPSLCENTVRWAKCKGLRLHKSICLPTGSHDPPVISYHVRQSH